MNITFLEYAISSALCIIGLYLIKRILRKRAIRFRNTNIVEPSPEFDEIRDRFMCLYQSDGTTRFGLSPRKK